MMKVHLAAEIPDELATEWLQYIRDFDVAHPACHFAMSIETEMSVEEIVDTMQEVAPPFATVTKFPRRE